MIQDERKNTWLAPVHIDLPLQVAHTYRNHQSQERLLVVPPLSPYFSTFVSKFHSKLLLIWLLKQVCSIFHPIDHIYENEWTQVKYRIKSQHYKKHHDVSLCSSRDVDWLCEEWVLTGLWKLRAILIWFYYPKTTKLDMLTSLSKKLALT
jgi:hypothetical protein